MTARINQVANLVKNNTNNKSRSQEQVNITSEEPIHPFYDPPSGTEKTATALQNDSYWKQRNTKATCSAATNAVEISTLSNQLISKIKKLIILKAPKGSFALLHERNL